MAWWPGAPAMLTATFGAVSFQPLNWAGSSLPYCLKSKAEREGCFAISKGGGCISRIYFKAASIRLSIFQKYSVSAASPLTSAWAQ